jgi:hypothetical protein
MSSARPFILVKYSAIEDDPFCAVARAILVVMIRARDCDTCNPWIAAQSFAVEVEFDTWENTSLDRDEKR